MTYSPRVHGLIQGTFMLLTAKGSFIINVKGFGAPSPYRVAPLIGAKVPTGVPYAYRLELYNPHPTPLRIIEAVSADEFVQLAPPPPLELQRVGGEDEWEAFNATQVFREFFVEGSTESPEATGDGEASDEASSGATEDRAGDDGATTTIGPPSEGTANKANNKAANLLRAGRFLARPGSSPRDVASCWSLGSRCNARDTSRGAFGSRWRTRTWRRGRTRTGRVPVRSSPRGFGCFTPPTRWISGWRPSARTDSGGR